MSFSLAITASIVVLLIIVSMLAAVLCSRSSAEQRPRDEEAGLDVGTLNSWTKAIYVEEKSPEKGTAVERCPVCLADYRDGDVLRRLPACGHLFHAGCVDPWLLKHMTCPVCRTSPVPSREPSIHADHKKLGS